MTTIGTGRRIDIGAFRPTLLGASLAWFILVGGTEVGSLYAEVRALNSLIAAIVIGLWIRGLPSRGDTVDRVVLAALVTFLAVCITSDYPRMSFDAATSALAFTASFSVVRWELTSPALRDNLATLLAACGGVIALLMLSQWLPLWTAWIAQTGSPPPLDLRLPVGPYRHPHVVAMLVGLLLPAALMVARRGGAHALVGAGLLGTAVIVVVGSGSRTVWVALTIALLGWAFVRRIPWKTWVGGVAGLAGLALVGLATGGVDALLARLGTTATLSMRVEIWAASLSRWLTDPLFGSGPGSFGVEFTLSDYFARYDYVGRHPDNAVVHMLVEGGLVGILAMALVATAVLMGYRRGTGSNAIWAVTAFAMMSLTDNPSDTAAVTIVAIAWAGLAVPHQVTTVDPTGALPPATRWFPVATRIAGATVGLAVLSHSLAAFAFDQAQVHRMHGQSGSALDALRLSVSLDPAQALYRRELGLQHLSINEMGAARRELSRAVALNPADTASLRALAVAAMRSGDTAAAVEWARRAVGRRASHEENALTLAVVSARAGQLDTSERATMDAVMRYPWLPAAPTWEATHLADRGGIGPLLRAAADDWSQLAEGEYRFLWPQVWINAATGRTLDGFLLGQARNEPELLALDAIIGCRIDEAYRVLDASPHNARDGELLGMLLTAALSDRDPSRELSLARIRGTARAALQSPDSRSAGWDWEEDRRLYRSRVVVPVDIGLELPTSEEGLAAWVHDPVQAAIRAAPDSGLAQCDPA